MSLTATRANLEAMCAWCRAQEEEFRKIAKEHGSGERYQFSRGMATGVKHVADYLDGVLREHEFPGTNGALYQRDRAAIERERELAGSMEGNPAYCDGYRHALDWVLDLTITGLGEDLAP